ncbi:sulfurtransferase-like selenium metabolism protein YedF [Perlabentimonas gracilis]|uniref:sulfurtransferase-like selenium metabolism protein YedF n=1 Tax=Perlabentimonas gracilis TaxID=2715279 RepID=UPI00140D99B9|nr:sulfurtransferase-like selenium metabolism protein YedF [Perlabentimonas gracilis]NHB70079.1 sulfurtransferase-like selenium metabolism protein YedF [Perlabentimonas gracilis]
MRTVDAKGELCPKPLIMTKKALGEMGDNETLEVLIDNETSMKNVTRFLTDNGFTPSVRSDGNVFHVLVNKTGELPESAPVEEYCEIDLPQKSNYVVAFQRDKLGDGAEELGKILIKAFINTLPEATNQPKSLVFLNAGIFLALKNSPVIESLVKLEKSGVKIFVCGTCLDYYGEKPNVGVGIVSNMYDILEQLSSAGSVVYP